MSADLVLKALPYRGPANAVPLVFGEEIEGYGDAVGTLHWSMPEPLSTLVGRSLEVERGTLGGVIDDVGEWGFTGDYDLAVYRGPRRSVAMGWQDGTPNRDTVAAAWEDAQHAPALVRSPIVDATPLHAAPIVAGWDEAVRGRNRIAAAWQQATPSRPAERTVGAQEAAATRIGTTLTWQEGAPLLPHGTTFEWQETHRRRSTRTSRWQEAAPRSRAITSIAADAAGLVRSWTVPWQEAGQPLPGKSQIIPTPPEPCYTPPPGDNVPLVFTTRWDGSTELTFVCTNHTTPPGATVVVPIQEVYMVSNDVSLVLADDGTVIPTRGFSLRLDYNSWSWSFSAQVPRAALPIFDMDTGGDPKTLTATVNGTAFSIIAESVDSDREFNTGDVTITGRGLIAALADPYAPTLTFGNTEARNAQQLVADVLTVNGVSMGWAVDWQLTDWLVPAGAWSFQGTYMAAVQAIAAAAGGYVQPTASDQTVRILPLFPTAPWTWEDMVPDYSLPSAVVSREGLSWSDRPAYNRIFVSGTTGSGVLGDVTRAGTAGDFEKPMVTDQLITHADAARQRGIAELGVGGRTVLVSLKLPVLPNVGVILPGKTVGYVDGDTTRKGIVRSVAVEAGFPTVYQTIGVETHV